jgi:catechol 2,3-dioxygenase-like lactoylglutathione lyase family enzyme
MGTKITHICLHVESIEDCVAFYRDYCKLEVIEDRSVNGDGSIYMSDKDSSSKLVLQFMSGGVKQKQDGENESHIGFAVETKEAVEKIASQARLEEILFFEPDEYVSGGYMCGVRDPNGNCVEFGHCHPVPPTWP